jgi:hypothetical protein
VASCDSCQILGGVFFATVIRVVRRWQLSQTKPLVDNSILVVDRVLVLWHSTRNVPAVF